MSIQARQLHVRFVSATSPYVDGIRCGFAMIDLAISRFCAVPAEKQAEAIRTSMAFLNSVGLTAIYDPGGAGIK